MKGELRKDLMKLCRRSMRAGLIRAAICHWRNSTGWTGV